MRRCPGCDVPRRFTSTHAWLDNGTIVERKNPSHRLVFMERENIAGVFGSIEEVLGLPIERLVVEGKHELTYDYVRSLIPVAALRFFRLTSIKPLARSITTMGRLVGLGDVELLSMRIKGDEGDYVKIGGRNLVYLPAYCGMVVGAMEAISGQECSIEYRETSPGYYEVTTSVSTHPKEYEERFELPAYTNKRGDVMLERCPTCGGPADLSQYRWDIEAGLIARRSDGRLMLVDGPAELDAIFAELEKELGEDIPQTVMDAQRRFSAADTALLEEAKDRERLRRALALRGLGNLRELDFDRDGLRIRLENPCLHPLVAGMARGLFEQSSGRGSEAAWRIGEDGDLTVEVGPAS